MAVDAEFRDWVLDQLRDVGPFETKNMFGGTAVLSDGKAFAKIKHGHLWLKVDDTNRKDFEAEGMVQYTYGKNNSRKLNFYQTPGEVLENTDLLVQWANKAKGVAQRAKR